MPIFLHLHDAYALSCGRAKVRAALYALNGRDLHDIGVAHSDIEYVASNPNLDPRGF